MSLFLCYTGCNSNLAGGWRLTGLPSTGTQPSGEASAEPSQVRTAAGEAPLDRPSLFVTTFTFDVLRIRALQGTFSDSGKIWNHLETDFLPADTTKLLHRNGLRVARAGTESWPPIRAILETGARTETAQSRLIMSNGLPLLLELDQQPRDQILFLYRRDGSLAGAPWRWSTNVLRIEYGLAPASPDSVLLEVAPELRLDSPAAQAPRGAEHWNPTLAVDRSRVITDLAFRVELAPGQFVAVGPSSSTLQLPYVMGSLLLCDETAGEKFESMYIITPTMSRTAD